MPLAIVTYGNIDGEGENWRPEGKTQKVIQWLTDNLPGLIAQHLGVPRTQAALTSSDVELEFKPIGPNDTTKYFLAIEIRANDYPERREILRIGTREIWNAIAEASPDLVGKFFVWPLLGFGEFVDSSGPPCKKCEATMEWFSEVKTYVCPNCNATSAS